MAKTVEKQDRCGQKKSEREQSLGWRWRWESQKQEWPQETIRMVQTALWVCLILVQMAVVNCLETRAEEIRRDVLYEAVEGEAEFPQEIEVTVLAGIEEELVTCAAERVEEAASYWSDDFTFPLTIYDYGADEYRLGDAEIAGADALKQLAEDYGAELLESMELLPEEYEVISLRWVGEPYENGEGIICRDAEGQGRRLLRDYRVTYRGFVEPERWEELRKRGYGDDNEEPESEMILETQEEEPESESAPSEPENKPAESPQEEPEKRQKTKLQEFLEKITQILLVAVGIGAVFFFGGLLVLLLIQAGRRIGEKRRKRKQERAYEKHVRDRKSH